MATNFSIRNMQENDIPGIQKIGDSWPGLLGNERSSIYWMFLNFLGDTCFVVESEGQVVGLLFGFLSQSDGETGYIHMIGVLPHMQNMGIGSALLEEFGKTIRKKGGRRILLTTVESNDRALSFYPKLGFVQRDILKLGDRRIEFSKDI